MVINPNSGKANSKAQLLDALKVFSEYEYRTEIYITQKQMDAHDYVKANAYRFDLVVVCGGDGTLNEVVNALMKVKNKPEIGYFPSGTVNDFSSNFNLSFSWKEEAVRICTGSPHPFDVGEVNGKKYFDYVAAFGAFCDVPYSTNRKQKEVLGTFAYFIEGITRLPNLKPIRVKMTINGKTYEYNSLFGLVFSGNKVASFELLSKNKASVSDGKFNVMIVDYMENIIRLPEYMSGIFEQTGDKIHWFSVDEVKFEFEERVNWTLDGEAGNLDKEVEIINHKKALNIIC